MLRRIVAGLHDCIVARLRRYTAADLHDYVLLDCTVVLHLRHLAANALANVLEWWLLGDGSWPQDPGLWAAGSGHLAYAMDLGYEGSGMVLLARICGNK